MTITEDNRYDTSTQVNHIRWYVARAYNGFAVDEAYGDYAGAPFGPGSARQILVLRRRDDG
ncbi:MAG: hypothetical protein ACM3RP_00235 [Chitinophagales bacterium]